MNSNPMTPLRAALTGAAVGAVASTVSYFAGQGVGWLVSEIAPTPDANIGLGMAMTALSFVLAPLLAWPMLRVLGVPAPGRSVLITVPFHVVFSFGLLMGASVLDPAPPFGFVWSALSFAAATALGVVVARATERPSGVPA
ncbi:hypothetical protein [Actinorugispora endophytica]|uniref:Major facilitator superfamily (MFS) profile domain-containing protein n=1 Tax=Actinorugispora endophytica TaxID=1605990 RepID=A0A4R6UGR1_9ACTN|nr:hypothetical protein [Actinorugispora endophytica]TDQ45988.1 hypothetical protein EV190_12747 [Actinorugispora endophytica]